MPLPAYTIAVARLFEAPSQADGLEARARAEFRALTAVLDAGEVEARCGSSTFEECDLSRLEAAFSEVRAEFERPQEEARRREMERVAQQVEALPMDKLARVAELLDRPQVRRGFRRVV